VATLVAVVGAAAALAALPARARAAEAGADSAGAVRDTTERKVKPFFVMARSAVLPGWGQVYNRQPLKAVVVVAGEGFLAYKIFHELRLQNDAIDRIAATDPETEAAEYDAALADELNHRNRKIDWIWWTAAGHLLQMADAYVDAHFINFDAEFGPDDDRIGTGARAAPRLSLALRVTF
jgi:hypothetical protein